MVGVDCRGASLCHTQRGEVDVSRGIHVVVTESKRAAATTALRSDDACTTGTRHIVCERQAIGGVVNVEVILNAGVIAHRDVAELHDLVAGVRQDGGAVRGDVQRLDIERGRGGLRDRPGDVVVGLRSVAEIQATVRCRDVGHSKRGGATDRDSRCCVVGRLKGTAQVDRP